MKEFKSWQLTAEDNHRIAKAIMDVLPRDWEGRIPQFALLVFDDEMDMQTITSFQDRNDFVHVMKFVGDRIALSNTESDGRYNYNDQTGETTPLD